MKRIDRFLLTTGLLLTAIAASAQNAPETICGQCQVERFASCGGFLEGASVDADNRLWVVDLLSGNIMRVGNDGSCEVRGNTGGQPNGARFHADGRLFIADKARGILAFNPADDELTSVVSTYRSESLRGVNDLVFDSSGGLYFTEPYGSSTLKPNGRVFYLSADGDLGIVADNIAFPNGVALSPDGNRVLVGEYANKQVLSLPSRQSQDIFDIAFVHSRYQGGIGPDGMALDTQGRLYAAIFQSGTVQVVNAEGFPLGSIGLPDGAGTFVTNLAFRDDYLYITEASQGIIWRVRVDAEGLPYFHQRP